MTSALASGVSAVLASANDPNAEPGLASNGHVDLLVSRELATCWVRGEFGSSY